MEFITNTKFIVRLFLVYIKEVNWLYIETHTVIGSHRDIITYSFVKTKYLPLHIRLHVDSWQLMYIFEMIINEPVLQNDDVSVIYLRLYFTYILIQWTEFRIRRFSWKWLTFALAFTRPKSYRFLSPVTSKAIVLLYSNRKCGWVNKSYYSMAKQFEIRPAFLDRFDGALIVLEC